MKKHIPVTYSGRFTYWCGPYALATLLGIEYDEAYMKCLRYKRKKEGKHIKVVKGFYLGWLEDLLAKNGSKSELISANRLSNKTITLGKVWDYLRPNSVYLVTTTTHFQVLDTSDKTMIDNWTCDWVTPEQFHNPRKRVVFVNRVPNHKCYLGE